MKNRTTHGPVRTAADAAMAACMALALQIDFTLFDINNYINWYRMLAGRTLALGVAFLAAFGALRYARIHWPRRGKGLTALAVLFGAWWVLAQTYADVWNVKQPFATGGQMLKSAVAFAGMALVYDLLLRGFDALIGRRDGALTPGKGIAGAVTDIYRRHPAVFCGVVVFICWMPRLVISYPAAMNLDTAWQMREIVGLTPWEDNDPIITTMALDAMYRAGRAIGSMNLALFGWVLVQAMAGAAVIGYAQGIMRRLGAARWLRALWLACCCVGTVYCDAITVILKDVPYTYACLLMLCEAARALYLDGIEYAKRPGFAVRVGLSALVMLAWRNNGIVIALAMGIALAVKLRNSRKAMACAALAVALPLLMTTGIKAGLRATREITPGSAGEGFSFMFQQTARVMREHGEEIPPEEIAIIDGVLDAQTIGQVYNEFESDPVKATYKKDAQPGDMLAYAGVWAKQMIRYPLTYAQATLAQNALLFDPQTDNTAVFELLYLDAETDTLVGAVKPDALWRLMDLESGLRMLASAVPLYAQMNSVGFFCMALLAVCVIARRERAANMGTMLLCGALTLAMIVLGPCLYQQDRYGYPIIYTLPLVMACLGHALANRGKT